MTAPQSGCGHHPRDGWRTPCPGSSGTTADAAPQRAALGKRLAARCFRPSPLFWLTAHGSRLTAHGSRLTAHGSRTQGLGSTPYSAHAPVYRRPLHQRLAHPFLGQHRWSGFPHQPSGQHRQAGWRTCSTGITERAA